MYCPNCGAQNSEDATYCANCGHELQKIETPGMDVPPPPQAPPQPEMQTSYAPQSSQPDVPNYLVPAILTTVFCCLPFGIVSIVYAAQVNGKVARGTAQARWNRPATPGCGPGSPSARDSS